MTLTTVNHLQQEYENWKALFENQPAILQHFFEIQAQTVANALISRTSRLWFSLPDRVMTQVTQIGGNATITIPETKRQYAVGSFLRTDVRETLVRRLCELEKSPDQAIAVSAGLLRYAAATYMIHNLLPAGRTVRYCPDGDEEIPTIPVDDNTPESAITQLSDAILEGESADGRGICRRRSCRPRGNFSCLNGWLLTNKEICWLVP
jgi:hypothetical protein